MRNIKITLQYEGSRYQGWQRQDSTENTLQGKLETLLGKMCGTRIEVQGAGRTDAGVHALAQIANFKLPDNDNRKPEEIMAYMNRYLPDDIAVIAAEEVPERFHSRLNAKGKTYYYRILNSNVPHVFLRRYAWAVEPELDVEVMRKTAAFLCGTHDFSAFTSQRKSNNPNKKSNVRTIYSIHIDKNQDEILFRFCGNGFLYHMIRIMVGTLTEAGTGKIKPEEVAAILASGQRENAGVLVPAKGLTLVEVHYSEERITDKGNFFTIPGNFDQGDSL